MTKLTLKEFISELNARLEKFTHAELKEIIRSRAMHLPHVNAGSTSTALYCLKSRRER